MSTSIKVFLAGFGLVVLIAVLMIWSLRWSEHDFLGEWGETTYGGVGGVEIRDDGTYSLFFKTIRGMKSGRSGKWVRAGIAASGRRQLRLIDQDYPDRRIYVEYDPDARVLILRNDHGFKQALYRMDD